jgi:hypothetical protein
MKQSRVSGFLCAFIFIVFSAVLQAQDANGKGAGEPVSQGTPVHGVSDGENLDSRILNSRRVNGLMNLGFLIGCGVIGYVLLRKANAS